MRDVSDIIEREISSGMDMMNVFPCGSFSIYAFSIIRSLKALQSNLSRSAVIHIGISWFPATSVIQSTTATYLYVLCKAESSRKRWPWLASSFGLIRLPNLYIAYNSRGAVGCATVSEQKLTQWVFTRKEGRKDNNKCKVWRKADWVAGEGCTALHSISCIH